MGREDKGCEGVNERLSEKVNEPKKEMEMSFTVHAAL